MIQQRLSRLYTLSLFVTGVLKHRVQIVEIIHDSAVTIQALHSDVILHVPDGVYGIILGNIHTDHWRFRHLVGKDDCIISPICKFHFHGVRHPPASRFYLQVPHIVRDMKQFLSKIRVNHGKLSKRHLETAQPFSRHLNPEHVYYQCYPRQIEISSPHFSGFLISTEGVNCCAGSAVMLAFSKMESSEAGPVANVATYLCSNHHILNGYRQVK